MFNCYCMDVTLICLTPVMVRTAGAVHMLYSRCCTAYVVRPTLYGRSCTAYVVRPTLYGQRCTANVVRPTLYGRSCTADVVGSLLYALRYNVAVLPGSFLSSSIFHTYLLTQVRHVAVVLTYCLVLFRLFNTLFSVIVYDLYVI